MVTKKLTITNFINTQFRDYALYTLTSRGIPGFYDSLTPVQRLILLNAPQKNSTTLSLVGDGFKDGYQHGDSALGGAINRLARTYDSAESLLIGDGFFGNQVTSDASAPRYTKIKINPIINEILDKYKYLNYKLDEGNYNHLGVDIPLGLLLPIIGIAVGYKTIILPRNLKDIQQYLSGKKKKMIPYFKGFKGKIESYSGLDNAWLIEGEVIVDEKNKHILIKSLPPLMKFESFLKKINKILDGMEYHLKNDSKDSININIDLSKLSNEDWEETRIKITKTTKLIIRESIVLVKDSVVLEYDSVEKYLDDFAIKNEFLKKDALDYNLRFNIKELKFLEAKLEFLIWMNQEISIKRTNIKLLEKDILTFINKFSNDIKVRLDDIKLRKLNEDEIRDTNLKIKEYIKMIKEQDKELKEMNVFLKTLPTKLNTKNNKILPLYEEDEIQQVHDIDVFMPSIEDVDDIEDEIPNI